MKDLIRIFLIVGAIFTSIFILMKLTGIITIDGVKDF